MPNWFLTKMQKQLDGGKINFSTNDTGVIKHLPIKKKKKEREYFDMYLTLTQNFKTQFMYFI